MIMNNSDFFDKNVKFYGKNRIYDYDYYLIEFIKKNKDNGKLLDIGGGVGTFAKFVITQCPNIDVTVVDTSLEMLNRIEEPKIKKIVGEFPDKISINPGFDYIHVKEVFHHVTGSSIKNTKILLRESLKNIRILLNDDGFLIIHELFYESPIVTSLSSTIIYYLCKIQNKYVIKLPIKEFLPGLNVYFYNRKELTDVLKEEGYDIIHCYEKKWGHNAKTRLLLLKDWGRIILVVKKTKG